MTRISTPRTFFLLRFALLAVLAVGFSATTIAQGDSCITAVAIGAGTHSADGPSTGGACFNCEAANATNADWYSFTAPSNGIIDINSCADPGDTDTRLWVYDGGCGALNVLAQNDDGLGGSCNVSGYGSSVSGLSVSSGTTYHIEWTDRWSSNGFDWDLAFTPVSCSNPSNFAIYQFDTTNARVSWTTPNIGAGYVIEYGAPGFALGTGMQVVGTIDSDPDSALITSLTPNTTYDIYLVDVCAVGDSSSWLGPIQFTTLCTPSATPVPHTENFDGGALPGCWTRTSSSDGWVFTGGFNPGFGLTNDHTTGATANGKIAWVDGSVGSGQVADNSLMSPLFDVSSLTTPTVQFWLHSTNNANASYATLHVNVWDGASWNNDVILWSGETAGSTWQLQSIDLGSLTITGPIQVEFVLDETPLAGNFQNDVAIDDFKVFSPFAFDVAPISLDSIQSACGLGASEAGFVSIYNAGTDTAFSVFVAASINGGFASIVGTFSDTLLAGDTVSIPVTLDLSATGVNNVEISIDFPGDLDTSNDTLPIVQLINFGTVSTLPYIESFESGPAGWISAGLNDLWEVGVPANAIIDTASHDTMAWVTNLTGNYPAFMDAAVYSPCFDLSSTTNPQVQLDVWWQSEFSWDGAVLQSTIDGGATWQNVGANGDGNNWFNDGTIGASPGGQQEGWTGRIATGNGSNGYVTARNSLTGLAGQASVQFRVAFASDNVFQDEGFAFDYFGINDSVTVTGDPMATSTCEGDSAMFAVTTTGGTPASYQWQVDTGSGFADVANGTPYAGADSDTLWITPTTAAMDGYNYRCLVSMLPTWTDTTAAGTLTIDSLPAPNIGPDSSVCAGDSLMLDAGAGYSAYLWSTGATSQTIQAQNAVAYSVTVTNSNGCVGVDTMILSLNAIPTVDLGPDSAICPGDTITLDAGASFAGYLWNTAATSQTIPAMNATTYWVLATDTNGCVGSDSVVVTIHTVVAPSLGGNQSICPGDTLMIDAGASYASYLWNNGVTSQTQQTDSAGSFWVSVVDTNGCSSNSDTITVTVSGTLTVNIAGDTAFCTGDSITLTAGAFTSYLWNTGATSQTIQVSMAGTYYVDVVSGSGCTGSDTTAITMNALPTIVATPSAIVACVGDSVSGTVVGAVSYEWYINDTMLVSTNNFAGGTLDGPDALTFDFMTVYGIDGNGCMGVDTIDFTIWPMFDDTAMAPICMGDSIMVGGAWQTTAGTYTDSLQSVNGCDSVITTMVTVLPLASSSASASICMGDSMMLGGAMQTTAGDYDDVFTAANGCDSTVTTTLTVIPPATTPTTLMICVGDSAFLGGAFQTTAGTYNDTLTGVNTCDSIVMTTLSLLSPMNVSTNLQICTGDSAFLEGAWQTANGTYTDSLVNVAGCDSIVMTTLSVVTNIQVTVNAAICMGDSLFAGGAFQTTAGMYFDTVASTGGCDSITTTNLTVNALPTIDAGTDQTVCVNDFVTLMASGGASYMWISGNDTIGMTNTISGQIDTADVFAAYVIGTDTNGCSASDSVMVTGLALPTPNLGADQSICAGNAATLDAGAGYASYLWNDNSTMQTLAVTTAGSYWVAVTDTNGCMGGDTTAVNFWQTAATSVAKQICLGDSSFLAGAWQTTSGSYVDSLQTSNGCDSIVTTALNVTSVITTSASAMICAGDSIFLAGAFQMTAGMYDDSLTAAAGCDSVVTTTLTVISIPTTMDTVAVCTGDSAFLAGAWQNATGDYTDTLTSGFGCDSIVMTHLDVTSIIYGQTNAWICSGDSIFVGGAFQSIAGMYTDTTTASAGCDSVTVTTLGIYPTTNDTVPATICDGESIMVGGALQTTAGFYVDVLSNSNGCDSIVTTEVIVLPVSMMSVADTICAGDSIFLAGAFQTTSGVYVDSMSTSMGCDSVITTTLTVLPQGTISLGPPVVLCSGATAVLDAGTFNSYLWSPGGQTTQTITVSTAGTYGVTVTSGGTCSSTGSVLVTTGTTPTVLANFLLDSVICQGASATLVAAGAGTYSWSPSASLNQSTGALVVASPTTTTTYTVTGSTSGCSNTATITLGVNAAPTITASQSSGGNAVCKYEEDVITVSTNVANPTFNWFLPGQTLVTSNNVIGVALAQTGVVTISVADPIGCTSSVSVTVTVDQGCDSSNVAVGEIARALEVDAWIAQRTEEMIVSLGDGHAGQYQLSVYNLVGDLVHSESISKDGQPRQERINLSGHATGFYIVKVTSNDTNYHEKLFKR